MKGELKMDYETLRELIEESISYVIQYPSMAESEIDNLTNILWKEMEKNNG